RPSERHFCHWDADTRPISHWGEEVSIPERETHNLLRLPYNAFVPYSCYGSVVQHKSVHSDPWDFYTPRARPQPASIPPENLWQLLFSVGDSQARVGLLAQSARKRFHHPVRWIPAQWPFFESHENLKIPLPILRG